MADEPKKDSSKPANLGQDEVQANKDEEEDKGYFGTSPDPTPDENYSMLTPPDAPTPETDPKLAQDASASALGSRWQDQADQRKGVK